MQAIAIRLVQRSSITLRCAHLRSSAEPVDESIIDEIDSAIIRLLQITEAATNQNQPQSLLRYLISSTFETHAEIFLANPLVFCQRLAEFVIIPVKPQTDYNHHHQQYDAFSVYPSDEKQSLNNLNPNHPTYRSSHASSPHIHNPHLAAIDRINNQSELLVSAANALLGRKAHLKVARLIYDTLLEFGFTDNPQSWARTRMNRGALVFFETLFCPDGVCPEEFLRNDDEGDSDPDDSDEEVCIRICISIYR